MEKPRFKGVEIVQRKELPYGLVRGEVAEAVANDYQRVLKERGLVDTKFALKNAMRVVKADGESFLSYTTPEAMMVLANLVPTKDYDFTLATPQQIAHVYNTNPDFILNKFWAEVQLVRNPHADLSKKENRIPWMMYLNEQLNEVVDIPNEFIAVPYSAVVPVILNNGHLGSVLGHELTENAKGLAKVIKWTKEQANGFKFNRFDENTGVPEPSKDGIRSFVGLTDKLFSALYVDRYLVAVGYRSFGYTDGDSRVVGWNIGEADTKNQ